MDTGAVDPRLGRALASGDRADLLAALVDARLFAVITATATGVETGAHGLRQESSAEMAVVLLEAPDGTRALPVFSDLGAMKRWRLDARPVPLTGAQACQAALDEGATTVLLDQQHAVTDLATLATGFVPVLEGPAGLAARVGETPLSEPEAAPRGLVKALRGALRGEPVHAARLLQSPDGLVLGVHGPDLGPAELAALAGRLVARLGPALPAEGLDLTAVPQSGPGLRVLPRWR